MTTPAVALSIAGSDSGGGAGIQADLTTFAALGVFGTSAISAVTAQDTTALHASFVLPERMVEAQVRAVLDDLRPSAGKTGMLATAGIVRLVGRLASAGALPALVVDPVMVASSGARLLEPDGVRAYLEDLIPWAAIVTPNMAEAAVLAGSDVGTLAEMMDAARAIATSGARLVVVKGGHLTGQDALDVVWDGSAMETLRRPRVRTTNVHGTGCTFSAAAAALMARGYAPLPALRGAKDYVQRAIEKASTWSLGRGHGPLNRLAGESSPRPVIVPG